MTSNAREDFPEPESACLWDKVYRKVIATGEPHSFVGDVREDGADRRYRARVWPLGGNRRDIDMLLCCREPVEEGDGAEPDRVENWET